MKKDKINIFWFRRDLRLNDNTGLYFCLRERDNVLPIFIFDCQILDSLPKQDRRVDFIHQSLANMQKELNSAGSSLKILHDKPINAFEKLFSEFDIESVYTNHDYEIYAIERDKEIGNFLKSKNTSFITFKDQVIFEKNEILKPDGKPYTVFTPYANAWKRKIAGEPLHFLETKDLMHRFYKKSTDDFPELHNIGFEKTGIKIMLPIINEQLIKNYHLTRNIPALDATTRLSVHLRFGTISVRKCTETALNQNETWLNELIWREFFMSILYHFPNSATASFKPKYERIEWINNENDFIAWSKGKTGYPIVDAGMRELNETGFMHNRVRMITASFLTKHLLVDWKWGERYFAEKLLDYECASNVGNWQWAAGSGCDAAPYFRVFNPYEQTKKFDPDLKYIKKWVPELDELEYPAPLVEHTFARNRALQVYKNSLEN